MQVTAQPGHTPREFKGFSFLTPGRIKSFGGKDDTRTKMLRKISHMSIIIYMQSTERNVQKNFPQEFSKIAFRDYLLVMELQVLFITFFVLFCAVCIILK